MRILLDTNIALLAVTDDPLLGDDARQLIQNRDNAVFVSAATLWEIAITPAHTLRLEELPRIHSDPFDRILIAQAFEEGCRLLTRDSVMSEYGEWVIGV